MVLDTEMVTVEDTEWEMVKAMVLDTEMDTDLDMKFNLNDIQYEYNTQ